MVGGAAEGVVVGVFVGVCCILSDCGGVMGRWWVRAWCLKSGGCG
jgi:hypothetical protein